MFIEGILYITHKTINCPNDNQIQITEVRLLF